MPWELRGQRWYYYRRRRIDGRVVTTYVGNGVIGELASIADLQRRQEREQNDDVRRGEQQRLLSAITPLRSANSVAHLLLRSVLLGTGSYRLHQRGEWRVIHGD